MSYVAHGRFDRGFAWIAEPDSFVEMSSTTLAVDGTVWLVDPLRAPGIEKEIGALGKPAGIIMTLGWHDRDVDWFASLYGIPVYAARHVRPLLVKTDVQRVNGKVPGTPFQLLDASAGGPMFWWKESVLWWPEEAVLVTGDSLGRASYFLRPGERLAVHPLVRLSPPMGLGALSPRRIFCGHGSSLHDGATAALRHALRTARPEIMSGWKQSFAAMMNRSQPRSSDAPSR